MNFSGQIVPDHNCPQGALGFGSFFEGIQNLLNFGVYLAVFFAVLMIAYAGFLLVTSAANPGNREAAKTAILQAVIGLLIVLGGWLIVNTVLVGLGAESLSSITSSLTGGDPCVKTFTNPPPSSGGLATGGGSGAASGGGGAGSTTPGTTPPTGNGKVNYVGDAVAQVGHESGVLANMLTCMAGKATFQVTSISDHLIVEGKKTFAQCAAGGAGCAHTTHSCHYGGNSCVGQSYAADIRNQSDNSAVIAAARACGSNFQGPEADHLHVSIGKSCGCN